MINAIVPEFSKTGFWDVPDCGRRVLSFNLGWRLMKGNADGAHDVQFDDSDWAIVNCPNGIEYDSTEASGSCNYRGVAWYRKHFRYDGDTDGRNTKLHFEGVMGKCQVWLNGEPVGEHFGGYLPFVIDMTGRLDPDGDNVLAVKADNSDDPDYPPGKEQTRLDFAYFGGIYRDVWLVSTSKLHVTNPNDVDRTAGGGIFARTEITSRNEAVLVADIDIQNDFEQDMATAVSVRVLGPDGGEVAAADESLGIPAGGSAVVTKRLTVSAPSLWTPSSPDLYRLEVTLRDGDGELADGVAVRTGLRTIDFRGADGFYLNGEPYPDKLIGVNRHQDHAYVGNAIPNNGQWRDALLIKSAGCDIVRAAHYPADPAFMDACDAVGLFFIVATPGWQFWNKENPVFEERVYDDIRNMVRRDRNYASVILWESILNETAYPGHFAEQAHDTVHEEYPYPGAFTACDKGAGGQECYDVVYGHDHNLDFNEEKRCTFTREFGDCVDDFNAHNSPSRVAREWGERAQLVQAWHYAYEPFEFTTLDSLHRMPRQHVGGTLWHGFDHQRGYHPDPFYGGLTDVFRQPKYSYYMFASQRDVSDDNPPMVCIAHEMTPFSEPDVHVFTNCEEVRLTLHNGQEIRQKKANTTVPKRLLIKRGEPRKVLDEGLMAMPHPIVTFKDVYRFIETKYMHTAGRKYESSLVAEGLIDGKVVATHRVTASKRPTSLILQLTDRGVPLRADGSDFVLVSAHVVDEKGVLKRLNENTVRFEVTGEGEIIGDERIDANPRRLRWGSAPALIRSTTTAGKIKIRAVLVAEGVNTPLPAELEIESVPADDRFVNTEVGAECTGPSVQGDVAADLSPLGAQQVIRTLEKELSDLRLREEERNQLDFDMNR